MLAYYGIQAAEFRMRHDAIFSSIRHYTWLISLLLAAPVSLLVGRERVFIKLILPYFIPISLLGVGFSIVAFFVVRREYYFYNESEARLLFLEREIGVTMNARFLDERLSKAAKRDFSVAEYAIRERPLGTILPWKARIRTLLLMEFWLSAMVGLTEVCIAIVFLAK